MFPKRGTDFRYLVKPYSAAWEDGFIGLEGGACRDGRS